VSHGSLPSDLPLAHITTRLPQVMLHGAALLDCCEHVAITRRYVSRVSHLPHSPVVQVPTGALSACDSCHSPNEREHACRPLGGCFGHILQNALPQGSRPPRKWLRPGSGPAGDGE